MRYMMSVPSKVLRSFIVASVAAVSLAACGGGEESIETLPVITAQSPVTSAAAVASVTTTTVAQAPEYYTIQQGDTLFGIAEAFGVTMDELISFNAIADPDAIQAGQRIQIPPGGTPPMPTAPASTTSTSTTP